MAIKNIFYKINNKIKVTKQINFLTDTKGNGRIYVKIEQAKSNNFKKIQIMEKILEKL